MASAALDAADGGGTLALAVTVGAVAGGLEQAATDTATTNAIRPWTTRRCTAIPPCQNNRYQQ